jgi:hypothetical protein
MSASAKFGTTWGFGIFIFLFWPFYTLGSHVALAQHIHRINATGRQVTVDRDIVVKFLIIHATELLPVMVKRITGIFIPHCEVTNTWGLSMPVASFSKTIFDGLLHYVERDWLIREMRGMMGVGVKHSTATVTWKKRMEIQSAFAAGGGTKKAWHMCTSSIFLTNWRSSHIHPS